jgi:glucokinase
VNAASASGPVLAVDIGGTKLAAGVVEPDGTLVEHRHVATPRGDDPELLWNTLAALIDGLRRSREATGVGVGCGGPMTVGGETVSPLNIPAWRDFPLRNRLAEHCGVPVWVDNDAKALALGEGWVGAATGERDYIGMVVSTGIGGGIVCDGRLLDGAEGNAGHVGHVIVEPDGQACGCGARGCDRRPMFEPEELRLVRIRQDYRVHWRRVSG